mgnify:FL=1
MTPSTPVPNFSPSGGKAYSQNRCVHCVGGGISDTSIKRQMMPVRIASVADGEHRGRECVQTKMRSRVLNRMPPVVLGTLVSPFEANVDVSQVVHALI